MTNESKAEADRLDPRDDEALWDLLGKQAPNVKVGPYFARRVLREVALAEERRNGWFTFLRLPWLPTPRHAAVWSGAFALGVLGVSVVLTIPASRPTFTHPTATTFLAEASAPAAAPANDEFLPSALEPEPLAEAALAGQDVETIADLDNLLAREESRLWTEDSEIARF